MIRLHTEVKERGVPAEVCVCDVVRGAPRGPSVSVGETGPRRVPCAASSVSVPPGGSMSL